MHDRPLLFIGSSTEALEIAQALELELEGICHVERWDRDVFEPGGYSLDSLRDVAMRVDYAVLIASPDDQVESRGATSFAPRDNVLLEFGMFVGVLGRTRAFLLATDELRLPSDVFGLTRLQYSKPHDGNIRRALNAAAFHLTNQMRRGGLRAERFAGVERPTSDQDALRQEIDLLSSDARAQGWVVRTNSATTLRLRSPKGKQFTLQKGAPGVTRAELRRFVAELRSAGLRVNSAIRKPVGSSPL